ncbi:VOC family protein [Pedobacter alpinus]|uniref:VOC family protein n=1 Tax=Pedobacter alpinus TaxID=1590643 RepID=A0ABW5TW57_9SPHI
MEKKICGIQQIGLGCSDIQQSWKWYRKYFNMDVPVFEDIAEAALMTQYTGNKVHKRHAILAMNMQGGGGFELWQFTNRKPAIGAQDLKIGDFGINMIKIKCRDVAQTFDSFKKENLNLKSSLQKSPEGKLHFYIADPYQNLFEITESESWFSKDKNLTGGVCGITIGVSDIEKSLKLYRDALGYDVIVYDETDEFEDLKDLNEAKTKFRRVLLKHSETKSGGFSRLYGDTEIELLQRTDNTATKIYKNRYWGDVGFIHVCFDVIGMKALKQQCAKAGFNFTVDSENSFDMGKAAGHFAYIADPDGTLIEFVETHKVPILKKLGIYLNLRNRNPDKNLPNWLVKCLAFARVKD